MAQFLSPACEERVPHCHPQVHIFETSLTYNLQVENVLDRVQERERAIGHSKELKNDHVRENMKP